MYIAITISIIIVIGIIIVNNILGERNLENIESKLLPYECGFEPLGDTRNKFEVKFFIIGILFIIFDLEVIFIYPLAVLISHDYLSYYGYWIFIIFIGILTIGYIYEWISGIIKN